MFKGYECLSINMHILVKLYMHMLLKMHICKYAIKSAYARKFVSSNFCRRQPELKSSLQCQGFLSRCSNTSISNCTVSRNVNEQKIGL